MPALDLEPPLDPCRSYTFLYPGRDRLEPHRLFVTRVHDVHRGNAPQVKWLVTGTDLELQAELSFQYDAMQEIRPLVAIGV
ncbi:MAG: hypothetical protein JSS49_16645 [Planctomycetes bacterium]|nr:hypothetical protein [Planctomycetota bacterium]